MSRPSDSSQKSVPADARPDAQEAFGPLQLSAFSLGAWTTNCLVLGREDESRCTIVDAGFDAERMLAFVQARALEPEAIVLTHAHVDHIASLGLWRDRFPDAPILIHRAEAEFLTDPALNLSAMLAQPVTAPEATDLLENGRSLQLAGVEFRLLHTPGHSPGGVTLHAPEVELAVVGDTLFAGGVGRYDFPTSDGPTLFASIRDKLLTLPDDTRVWPGHGPPTTIGAERRANPFLV